jgi:transposase
MTCLLMPERLDDYFGSEKPARVVDAFVVILNLAEMACDTSTAATGCPSYYSGVRLKRHIYG